MTDKNDKPREKLTPLHLDPVKPAAKPAEPKREEKPAEEDAKDLAAEDCKRAKDASAQEAFNNGRWARSNAIAKDQAPLMSDADLKEWRKGWDHENKARGG